MNILRLAAELFLIYILYKLIFDFIIPIYRTTNRVKKQFGEMNAKMQEKMNSDSYRDNQQQNVKGSTNPKEETVKKEDYIDYEEIK